MSFEGSKARHSRIMVWQSIPMAGPPYEKASGQIWQSSFHFCIVIMSPVQCG